MKTMTEANIVEQFPFTSAEEIAEWLCDHGLEATYARVNVATICIQHPKKDTGDNEGKFLVRKKKGIKNGRDMMIRDMLRIGSSKFGIDDWGYISNVNQYWLYSFPALTYLQREFPNIRISGFGNVLTNKGRYRNNNKSKEVS